MLRTVLVFVCLAVGCESKRQPPPADKAPAGTTARDSAPESQPESEPTSAPASKPGMWTFEGTPDAVTTLTARSDSTVDLKAACDRGAEPIGSLSLEEGKVVEWTAGQTVVTRPLAVRATAPGSLSIAPVTKDLKATDATIDLAVPEGRVIGILKPAGKGRCYVVIESMVGIADCPTSERFEADGWSGDRVIGEHFWCVQPTGHEGWLVVDESQFSVD